MDLQFILILIGSVIVAFIAWDGWRRVVRNRDKNSGNSQNYRSDSPRRTTHDRPQIEPVLDRFSAEPSSHADTHAETIEIDSARQQFQADNAQPLQETKPVQRNVEKKTDLIVFFILAKPGKAFSGIDLFHQFERLYLCFGDMDIFHRHKSETGEGAVLFSVASALEPGIFNYDEPENFSTTGLTLFMQLPGEFDGGDAFETLLHTARLLTQRLDANLCDNTRKPMTADTLEKYRLIAQQYG